MSWSANSGSGDPAARQNSDCDLENHRHASLTNSAPWIDPKSMRLNCSKDGSAISGIIKVIIGAEHLLAEGEQVTMRQRRASRRIMNYDS